MMLKHSWTFEMPKPAVYQASLGEEPNLLINDMIVQQIPVNLFG